MKKTRVLIVEDNDVNLYLSTFLLEAAGCEVVSARDGAAGVESARHHRPCVIVMDLALPVMDGFEAARTLKAHPDTAAIPIVASTAYAMAGELSRAQGIGFADYIEKPIDPDTFAARVLQTLTALSP